jgi:flagellin-like hook-associated protein FlgL
MANIVLTAAMRSNLASLQTTAMLLGQTQQRLASGNKINSALDNPSSFFAAQGLNNRANDLSALLDSMGQSVQALKAADKGISALTALAEQAKSIAQTALAQATGGAFYTGTASLTAANQADITTTAADAADQFTVQVGSGPVTTFTIAASESLATLVAELNTISGLSVSLVADAANSGNVFVQVRTTNGQSVTFTELGGNTAATAIFGAGVLNGGNALAATNVTPTDRVALETSYNAIRTQIDNMVKDTGYAGKNLLNGDSMTVQFNEKNTTSVTVTGTKRDSAGLTISAATFDTVANIQASLTDITDSLNLLRADGTYYGNNLAVIQARQDFTTSLVATLKDGATSLTIADKNEEGANLLALQTSQQLGIQALALASQANQSVLRLFA